MFRLKPAPQRHQQAEDKPEASCSGKKLTNTETKLAGKLLGEYYCLEKSLPLDLQIRKQGKYGDLS